MQSWLKEDMKERLKGTEFKPPKNFYVHFDFISADDWGSKEYEKQKMMDYIMKNKKFDDAKNDSKVDKYDNDEDDQKKKQNILKIPNVQHLQHFSYDLHHL